jgi:ribosomal protein S18 acetylase RimI-like enzyme
MTNETVTTQREPVQPANVQMLRMTTGDAGELLTLQRAAYAAEAQQSGDPFLPALTQTLEELVEEIQSGGGFVLKVNGRLVGAVRTRTVGGELQMGRLTVAPDMQGRGFGGALLFAAEQEAARTDVMHDAAGEAAVLYTGSLSDANIRLYVRRGYVETHRETLRDGVELVHLHKEARVASSVRDDLPSPHDTASGDGSF